MRNDYFAEIADSPKNQCKACKACKEPEKSNENNELISNTALQNECKANVRNVRSLDRVDIVESANLTFLTPQCKTNVRHHEDENDNYNKSLTNVLHILHPLHEKKDNCATPRTADEQEAFEERAAIMEFEGNMSRQEAERKAASYRPVHARVRREQFVAGDTKEKHNKYRLALSGQE